MRRSLERAGSPQPGVRPQPGTGFEGFQPSRSQAARPRQRFVQDGEVPVTLVSRPRQGEPGPVSQGRLAASEAALATERTARIKVERSLQAALASLQDLQTKQRHAELAQQEALQAAHAERQAAEARFAEQAGQVARLEAELATMSAAMRVAKPQAQAAFEAAPDAAPDAAPAKPKRGLGKVRKAALARTPREPKPVKWWLGQTVKARTPKLG